MVQNIVEIPFGLIKDKSRVKILLKIYVGSENKKLPNFEQFICILYEINPYLLKCVLSYFILALVFF